jgi:hypothetical protein
LPTGQVGRLEERTHVHTLGQVTERTYINTVGEVAEKKASSARIYKQMING